MTRYTAIVEQSDPGWSIYVPEVDRHTWAPHLREVEDMARDLVQVMTDLPIDTIEVSIQLPARLGNPIAEMVAARDNADAAESAARDAQRRAAAALRQAGAPLRDIAVTLGVSHQRVHQILNDVSARAAELEVFRDRVAQALADGHFAGGMELPVTGDDGTTPIVVALGDELLSAVQGRIRDAGGSVNLFVQEESGLVRVVAVIDEACAIGEPSDDMTGANAPGVLTTASAFLDHVANHPDGVMLNSTGRCARASDLRPVELCAA